MKAKQDIAPKTVLLEKIETKTKPKSLRPMRSMMAVRSLKPKTGVAAFMKSEEAASRN